MDNLKNSLTNSEDPCQPKVTDFEMFLPWACIQFSIATDVIVTRATQKTYVAVVAPTKKGTSRRKISALKAVKSTIIEVDSDDDSQSDMDEKSVIEQDMTVRIKTLYDSNDKLVQIKFLQNKKIPRKIMQVIGLATPYHKQLTSITIDSGLRMDTLYELAKFLPNSNITELCLDSTFLTKANYHLLLTHSKLKHLSLARCSINDVVVKTITDQLGAASPASRVLSALNLSLNRITDVGAKCIADMLRTNRQLSYLNLAGNMITDEGGMNILDILKKFPLGSKECLESRARYVAYLKKKNEFIEDMILELQTAKHKVIKKKSMLKGSLKSLQRFGQKPVFESVVDARIIQEKAEHLAATEMEPFNDPFSPNNTESQEGVVRCFGNNTLCYLNLAYNNLTYASVRKLHEVLLMQRALNRTPRGLIKVVIEGNLMPVTCKEYEEINFLFKQNVSRAHSASTEKTKSTKSSTRLAKV